MKKTRREFLKQTSIAAAALAVPKRGVLLATPSSAVSQGIDSFHRDVCILALDAARGERATYADARIVNRRTQYLSVRDRQRDELNEAETFGIGVRALVDGAWGFASSENVSRQEGRRVAEQAVQQARINSRLNERAVELAPVDPYPEGVWHSPMRIDPFSVPINDKAELLINANSVALSVPSVRSAFSFMSFVREEKMFASTDGSIIAQTSYRSFPSMTVTAGANDSTYRHARSTGEIAPMGLGYEHVMSANLSERARELADEAVQGLSATAVDPGLYDLILDPTNLQYTIHETIGRATELDRALGYEASNVAPSFLAQPEEVIESLQYGPEFMNILCDRTQRGGLATVGWDDEGVPQDSWPIIRDGIFVDYQTTREQVARIADLTGTDHSHGCSAAQSWEHMQMQRMPNVSLLPGEDDYVVDDLIAATDRGIYIKGMGSSGVDRSPAGFQFGGEAFFEVRGGQIVGQLKDVAYRGSTLEFWNSMDMLGGHRSYVLGGTMDDLKGQPAQKHAVSHGCPPARFHQCAVLNTAN
jgi:TldD protein